MSTEEIDGIVCALTIVAESLETEVARQSMQDAFMHVRAHALAQRRSGAVDPGSIASSAANTV